MLKPSASTRMSRIASPAGIEEQGQVHWDQESGKRAKSHGKELAAHGSRLCP